MTEQYRQGDVLLIETDIDFKDGKEQTSNVLVEGKITGHHHRVINGKIYSLSMPNATGLIIAVVQANKGCYISHEEHKPIFLPEGLYEVRKQRELIGEIYD